MKVISAPVAATRSTGSSASCTSGKAKTPSRAPQANDAARVATAQAYRRFGYAPPVDQANVQAFPPAPPPQQSLFDA